MKIILLAILTASIAIASIAHAKRHHPEKIVTRVTEKLSLNETQQNYFQAFIDEKIALRSDRHKKHKSWKLQHTDNKKPINTRDNSPFASLLEKDSISVNDVNQAIDEVHTKKSERVITAFVTFYNSLDKQQREQVTPMSHRMLRGIHGPMKHGKK